MFSLFARVSSIVQLGPMFGYQEIFPAVDFQIKFSFDFKLLECVNICNFLSINGIKTAVVASFVQLDIYTIIYVLGSSVSLALFWENGWTFSSLTSSYLDGNDQLEVEVFTSVFFNSTCSIL